VAPFDAVNERCSPEVKPSEASQVPTSSAAPVSYWLAYAEALTVLPTW